MLSVRQSRRQRGASMVELALVLFILLLLVAAIADFGRVFNHYVVVANASREGARRAALEPDDMDAILESAKLETQGSSVQLEDDNIAVDPDPPDVWPETTSGTEYDRGEPITVTVSYTVPTILADIAGFGSLPLRVSTTMAIQGPEEYDG